MRTRIIKYQFDTINTDSQTTRYRIEMKITSGLFLTDPYILRSTIAKTLGKKTIYAYETALLKYNPISMPSWLNYATLTTLNR